VGAALSGPDADRFLACSGFSNRVFFIAGLQRGHMAPGRHVKIVTANLVMHAGGRVFHPSIYMDFRKTGDQIQSA